MSTEHKTGVLKWVWNAPTMSQYVKESSAWLREGGSVPDREVASYQKGIERSLN